MDAIFDFQKGRLRQVFRDESGANTTYIVSFDRKVTVSSGNASHGPTSECWLGDFTEELAAVRAQFIRSPEMFAGAFEESAYVYGNGGPYLEWDSFVVPREERVRLFMEGAGGDAKTAETLADTRDIYHTSPTGVPLLRIVVHHTGNATTAFLNFTDLAKAPPGDEIFRTPKGVRCKEVPAGQPGREAGFEEGDEDDEDDEDDAAAEMEDDEVEDDEVEEGDEDEEDEEDEESEEEGKEKKEAAGKSKEPKDPKEPKHTEL